MHRPAVSTLLALALSASARATTLYVANNGVDGPGCGPKDMPCRSISQAVNVRAAAGDGVVVGPGTYGDLNFDGVLGDSPGEETGAFGCMIVLAQTVTLTSSVGAAATVIDGRSLALGCNVGLLANGARFGKPGKGFTVTDTNQDNGVGIQLAGTNEIVSGNDLVGDYKVSSSGIETLDTTDTALVTANQVLRWGTGITALGSAKTVSKNEVSQNEFYGIYTNGSNAIVGNVVTDNGSSGLYLAAGRATVTGNAVFGNLIGLFVTSPFSGTIAKNDIFANRACGLENGSTGGSIS